MQGWVTIEADTRREAERKILAKGLVIPRQRVRRYAPAIKPREPLTRHGRVLVIDAIQQCGPDAGKKLLLKLDCGHSAYIDADLWFPKNPYLECSSCTAADNAR